MDKFYQTSTKASGIGKICTHQKHVAPKSGGYCGTSSKQILPHRVQQPKSWYFCIYDKDLSKEMSAFLLHFWEKRWNFIELFCYFCSNPSPFESFKWLNLLVFNNIVAFLRENQVYSNDEMTIFPYFQPRIIFSLQY